MFKLLQISSPGLSFLDWTILFIYGVGMLGIGWYYQRKNKTKEEYLLGGRKMKPVSIGISLFATLVSTLSYITTPGEMILHGPIIFAGGTCFSTGVYCCRMVDYTSHYENRRNQRV